MKILVTGAGGFVGADVVAESTRRGYPTVAAQRGPFDDAITAALVGTMAANVFYLTMQMYYFTGLIALGLAVPLLLARRARAVTSPTPPAPG